MRSSREIITIQVGDYANHVATHFWNLEWENARLHTNPNGLTNHEQTEEKESRFEPDDSNSSTNPYQRSSYQNLKRRAPSNVQHSGVPNIKQKNQWHRNLDPNVCFHSNRQSIASNGIKDKMDITKTVYTPRTIIFAAHGSEGNINSDAFDASSNRNPSQSENSHSAASQSLFTWDGDVNVVQQQSIPSSNNNSSNENSPRFWSDYLLPSLHEKSLFLMDGVHHFSTPFSSYSSGHDLMNGGTSSSSEMVESMDDRIRWFVESCDWFQGFQLFASSYDATSGLLPSLTELLHDDYSGKCLLVWDCIPSSETMIQSASNYTKSRVPSSTTPILRKRFKMNSMIAQSEIWNEVSNLIPISVDDWDRSHDDRFNNTSIIASCIHSFTGSARQWQSRMRLMDIVRCTVRRNALKMSMLSSCSSHLDLNLNFQAIDSVEKMFIPHSPSMSMKPQHSKSTMKQIMNQPIFSRLSCLGPVNGDEFRLKNEENEWRQKEVFGEYSCFNGSALYHTTSSNVINEWKQQKMMRLKAQKSSSSSFASDAQDVDGDSLESAAEQQRYHMKLMAKLVSNTLSPIQWTLNQTPWRLPNTHPFYVDEKKQKNPLQNEHKESAMSFNEELQGQQLQHSKQNEYSIWSSGWSASIIGTSYLKGCGQSVGEILRKGYGHKIFGDAELDLLQCKEHLLSLADSYEDV